MVAYNKYFGTGSNPCYLNLSSTAKDFSFNDTTSPQYGLLDNLTKFVIVEEDYTEIVQPVIQKNQWDKQ
jgi:hypothetical protein